MSPPETHPAVPGRGLVRLPWIVFAVGCLGSVLAWALQRTEQALRAT
ncbi:MAG: hypothetical protein ACO3DQ_09765 [Cephaloticoccus sp.]